ncbi:hypothetical protein DRQ20_04960 [bacterium]|nr:MAG: hypothetical protein DRQ20_04960 [bacterium]
MLDTLYLYNPDKDKRSGFYIAPWFVVYKVRNDTVFYGYSPEEREDTLLFKYLCVNNGTTGSCKKRLFYRIWNMEKKKIEKKEIRDAYQIFSLPYWSPDSSWIVIRRYNAEADTGWWFFRADGPPQALYLIRIKEE